MPSDSPNYQLLERTPQPSVTPEHPHQAEPGSATAGEGPGKFCMFTVLRLESGWPVWCGLRADQHPEAA